MSGLEISIFEALPHNSNYGFLLHDPQSGLTAAIDTPEFPAIQAELEARGWTLTHILNTHHHYDHVGANEELAERYDLEIVGYGPDARRIPGITRRVEDGDVIDFGGHDIRVMAVPGHTVGHIAYYVPDSLGGSGAVFVGDTVFVMGCGRLFEGSPAQMYDSLARIGDLPPQTAIYCAHEYTLSNAKFAETVEPENAAMQAAIAEAKAKRARGEFTVPTTVERELATNPFLRAATAERLGEIRAAKDAF